MDAPPRVLHLLGVKNGHPNASIVRQIDSLNGLAEVVPICYSAGHIRGYRLALRQVKAALKADNVQIVHAHHSRSGQIALWAVARRVPVVVSFLGSDLYNRRLLNSLAYRSVIRRAAAIIVKSQRMREMVSERQDCHVVPNGVDMGLFRPMDRLACRRRLGLNDRRPYVLFAADPKRPEKNFPLAEAAMTWLRTKHHVDDCALLVVHGVPSDRIVEYMNACNCVILTSSYEGSPNVIKEAMACNACIVSTDVGDVRELVNDAHGCRIVNGDSTELGDALFEVLSNETVSDGRPRIAHLSMERVAQRISHIYQSVVYT